MMRSLLLMFGLPLCLASLPLLASDGYVDARLYPDQASGWQRFGDVERALVAGFDDVCGDTFCEGEYYNLQAMRLRCSVERATGHVAHCIWTFAGSNTSVKGDGRIDADLRSYACPLSLAAGTPLETLLQAWEAVPARDSIDVPLPGTSRSVYDGLTECL
ncbi:hypothetical protein [Stenotrophomonas sp. NPDC077659]|uniref:hypothetical protein n=1 Tax=Stenotrophomonas sp. NPDC077659 TaxID=3390694 RepID=UPI003CFCCBB0